MMNLADAKLYGLNCIGLIINFSTLDIVLKIILTVVITGYTLHKWYLMNENAEKNQ